LLNIVFLLTTFLTSTLDSKIKSKSTHWKQNQLQ